MSENTKYIFVTGGVTSSLGKGIISASLANLLQSRGYKVTIQKLDPYINVDPGTLNPYEHGECYVTDDGAETDLDLGHYERFTSGELSRLNSLSSGQVYETVIPRNIRISEAPSHGKPVLLYDYRSPGAQAYIRLAQELLRRERALLETRT